MESVYNKTFTPLNAGDLWKGRSEIVDLYNIACVSCASDTDGLLSLLQSQNDINYDFASLHNIVGGTPFNINEKIKAKYYRVMFENTSVTNQTYLRLTTVYKNAVQDNLDVTISNDSINVSGKTQFYDGESWVNASSSNIGVLNTFDDVGNTYLAAINTKIPADLTVFGNRLFVDNGASIVDNAMNVNVVSGGGGGGGLVQLQGYEGTGWADLTATSGKLNVNDSSTTSLDGKVFNATTVDTEAIKVFTVNSSGGGSSTIQAVLPNAPTVAVPLSASTWTDSTTLVHYPLETQSNIFGLNTTTGDYEPVAISATGNQLVTQSRTHTANGLDVFGTVVNTVRGLNIYNVGNDNIGGYANISNNVTITSGSNSSSLNINNTYMNESVLLYRDSSVSLSTAVVVQVSTDNTNWMNLTTLYPVVSETGKRNASVVLKLKAFQYIRILNVGVASYDNVYCSVFSS